MGRRNSKVPYIMMAVLAVAIAALNGLDLNEMIIKKDRAASVKYHHRTNLERFVLDKRSKESDGSTELMACETDAEKSAKADVR